MRHPLLAYTLFAYMAVAEALSASATPVAPHPAAPEQLCRTALDLARNANQLPHTQQEEANVLRRKAIHLLKEAVEKHKCRNRAIFYDIGNLLALCNENSQALLFYRKAEFYSPADTDLLHNIQEVRLRLGNPQLPPSASKAQRRIFFWHYGISYPWREIVFLCSFTLFWLTLLLRQKWRSGFLGMLSGIVLLLTILFGISLGITEYSIRMHPNGVILAREVIARTGNAPSYGSAFQAPLPEGTEFRQIQCRNGWRKIRLAMGEQAWIPEEAAALTSPHANTP